MLDALTHALDSDDLQGRAPHRGARARRRAGHGGRAPWHRRRPRAGDPRSGRARSRRPRGRRPDRRAARRDGRARDRRGRARRGRAVERLPGDPRGARPGGAPWPAERGRRVARPDADRRRRAHVSDDGAPERRQAVLDGLAERASELNGTFEATPRRRRHDDPPHAAAVGGDGCTAAKHDSASAESCR